MLILCASRTPLAASTAAQSRSRDAATCAPDTVLVELRVGAAARMPVLAIRHGAELRVPVAALVRLAGLAAWPPAPVRGGAAGTAPCGRGDTAAAPRTIPVAAIAAALGVGATVDWRTLSVTLHDTAALLPVTRRGRLLAALAQPRTIAARPPRPVRLPLASFGGTIAYEVYQAGRAPPAGRARLTVGALGGTVEWEVTHAGRFQPAMPRWSTVHETGPVTRREWRVGAIGMDAAPVGMIGLAVVSGRDPLAPALPTGRLRLRAVQGTVAAVTVDGAQVGVDSTRADGTIGRVIALHEGVNHVTITGYPPNAPPWSARRTIIARSTLLPPRRVEYRAAMGRCASSVCRDGLTGAIRWGAAARVTLEAHAALLRAPRRMRAPAGIGVVARIADNVLVSAAAGDATSLAAELALGPVEARAAIESVRRAAGRVRVTTTAGWHGDEGMGGTATAAGDSQRQLATLTTAWRARLASLRVRPVLHAVRDGTRIRLLPAAAVELYGAHGVATLALAPSLAGSASMGIDAAVPHVGRVGASLRWPRGMRHVPQLSLAVTPSLAAVRVDARIAREPDGRTAATRSVSGAVALATGFPVTFSDRRTTGSARLVGRLFLDRDQDGCFTTRDVAVGGIGIRIGGTRAVSSADGRFTVAGLPPRIPVTLQIDTAAIAARGYAPAPLPDAVIAPDDGTVRLDIPLAPAATLVGRIDFPAGWTPGAVPLELRDANGRGAARRFTTFGDGTFVVDGVHPGRYNVRLDDRAAGVRTAATAQRPQIGLLVATGAPEVTIPLATLLGAPRAVTP